LESARVLKEIVVEKVEPQVNGEKSEDNSEEEGGGEEVCNHV